MKTKLLSMLLVVAMLCALLVPSVFAESVDGTAVSTDGTGSKVTVSDKDGGGLTVTVTQSGAADISVTYDFGVFLVTDDIKGNAATIDAFVAIDGSESLSDVIDKAGATNLYSEDATISAVDGVYSKDITLTAGTYYVVAWINGTKLGAAGAEITVDANGKLYVPTATISPAENAGLTAGADRTVTLTLNAPAFGVNGTAGGDELTAGADFKADGTIKVYNGTDADADITSDCTIVYVPKEGNTPAKITVVVPSAKLVADEKIKVELVANKLVDEDGTAFAATSATYTVSAGETNTVNAGADKSVVYGDAEFTQAATATAGTPTYASSNTDVATVDTSGKVTIVGVGEATITATVSTGTYGGTTYAAGSDSYKVTVAPKPLTLTFSGNTAGATLADVTSALTGVETGDTVGVTVTWTEVTGNVTETDEAGNETTRPMTNADVTLEAGSSHAYTVTLTGANAGNYTLAAGTMTVAEEIIARPSGNFTVTYNVGIHGALAAGSKSSEQVKRGESPKNVPDVVASKGYTFIGWSTDGKTLVDPSVQVITKSMTFTAVYAEHNAYMVGRGEGMFVPNGQMTRAEAATILARLTEGFDEDGSYPAAPYNDLEAGAWYVKYISFAADKGIVNGYEDGTFQPNKAITRAELATMIANYVKIAAIEDAAISNDVADHWAKGYIAALEKAQIVKGYEDGTFKPNQAITRAEAATMVNRAIGRVPMADLDLGLSGYANPFKDVSTTQWFYFNVMEATVAHLIVHFHK